jgi:hypothetical protein
MAVGRRDGTGRGQSPGTRATIRYTLDGPVARRVGESASEYTDCPLRISYPEAVTCHGDVSGDL